MKQPTMYHRLKYFYITAILMSIQLLVKAQDKIVVDKQEVGNWFQRNWMWVAGGVVLLILIIALGSGSRSSSRKTTTVVKDDFGNVKSVTTTEVNS